MNDFLTSIQHSLVAAGAFVLSSMSVLTKVGAFVVIVMQGIYWYRKIKDKKKLD